MAALREGAMGEPVGTRERGDGASSGGNGVGIAAFVTGCLGLGPVAIVLGAVGLSRFRRGQASRRGWPLAGLVLGIVGTFAVAALAVVFVTSDVPAQERDLLADVDAVNLGNATVDWYAANPMSATLEVTATGSGYAVGGTDVAAALPSDADAAVSIAGSTAYDWCLTLTYAGGTRSEVAYSATDGLKEACR